MEGSEGVIYLYVVHVVCVLDDARTQILDYALMLGVLEKAEGEEGADASVDIAEPRGAPGINKMVYWACNSPTE